MTVPIKFKVVEKINQREEIVGAEKTSSAHNIGVMVTFLGLGYLCSMMHRQAFTIMFTYIVEDIHMDPAQLGILGAIMLYTYAFMQIPGGMLADHIGPRMTIALSLVLTACSALLLALSKTFFQAVASRAVAGLATAAIYVPSLTAIRKWCPEDQFPFMTSLVFLFGTIGGIVSKTPLSMLTDIVGWRRSYFIMGIVTFVVAIAVWLFVPKENRKNEQTKNGQSAEPAGKTGYGGLWSIVFSIQFISLAVWLFAFTGTSSAFEGLWVTVYLMEIQQLTRQQVATMLTILSVSAMAIGPTVGAIARTRMKAVFAFSSWWRVLFFGVFRVLPGNMSFGANTGYFLAKGLSQGGLPIVFSQIRTLVPEHQTGTLLGVANTVSFMGGAILTQVVGVAMNKVPTSGLHGAFNNMFMIFAVFTGAATIFVWNTNFSKRRLSLSADESRVSQAQ